MGKLSTSIAYQTIYQLLLTVTPLITTPFIARTIGADGFGMFSYSLSVVNYFMIFCMLGIANYGCRTIAANRNDKIEMSNKFIEIYLFQFVCSFIAVVIYYIAVYFIAEEHFVIFAIQGIWIISCCFDVSWFFWGLEKFKITATRSIAVRLLSVIAIFAFVRRGNGLIIYSFIMAASTLLNQVLIWIELRKEIIWKTPTINSIIFHIKPNLKLFAPSIAESVYHNMDKTMLGKLSTEFESGYYYSTDKLVNIPKGIVNATSKVFMSRMSNIADSNDKVSAKQLMSDSLEVYSFVVAALAFGIAGVSKDFIPVFFGAGFEKCYSLLAFFCPILVLKSYSIFLETEYFIPFHQENKYTLAVVIGATVNVIANFCFIRRYGAVGAALGTLLAEGAVFTTLFVCYVIKEKIVPVVLLRQIPYYIFGICMYVVIICVSKQRLSIALRVISETIAGGCVYIILCAIYCVLFKRDRILKIKGILL